MATERENSEVPQWNTAELDCVETAPDLLDRTSFVGHLAQGLLRSRTGESLVTAIYGPWGSGKSWIKHRLIEELRTLSPELITVEFSPWQIRGVDELTLQFFSQVYEKIDPPAPPETVSAPSEGARLWAQLARLSGVVPAAVRIVGGAVGVATGDPGVTAAALAAAGAGENFAKVVGARAAEAKSEAAEADEELPLTVQETRRRLEAFFNPEAASRLLVIMDDFDRLTADEIQAMVRLIKANANFSGLNYCSSAIPSNSPSRSTRSPRVRAGNSWKRSSKIPFDCQPRTRKQSLLNFATDSATSRVEWARRSTLRKSGSTIISTASSAIS
jgi:Cdc6-like AAA superfamily ATPase